MVPVSFEFYPPKTPDQHSQFDKTVARLRAHSPEYVSVTFGAGGSTLSHTPETIQKLRSSGLDAAPHITCMGGSREEIRGLLKLYRALGAKRLVALRGDLPSGMVSADEFRYAEELVKFVREETGDHFHIEVAAYPEMHPQARDNDADLRHFVGKVRAGANGAITQYFYNADAYFRFIDDARRLGVDVPIVPGIMPIANFSQIRRFSDLCGAEIPRWIAQRMLAYGDDADSVRAFGAEVVAQLCNRLVAGGAPSLHFYTLNLSKPSLNVLAQMS